VMSNKEDWLLVVAAGCGALWLVCELVLRVTGTG